MATLTIADLDNGKRDLQTVSEVANSRAATATTRFGQQTTTLYEAIRRINATGDDILSNLGFRVPVPYASGLNVTDSRFTVTGPDGKVYAPLSAPFTTGAWDPSQWYVLQNDLNDHKLLVFDTLLEAEAAAAVLPDGQPLALQGSSARYEVLSGALHVLDIVTNVFAAIEDATAAELAPGDTCWVKETTFKVVSAQPKVACIPVIPSKYGYLVPVDNHVSRRFGGVLSRGQITNTADFKFNPGGTRRSCQGVEFDRRAGTVILVSLNADTSAPEQAKFIEYEYSPSTGIGAEVMRTADIPIGHGEDFAIVYEGANRFIWTRDGDNKGVLKVQLVPGATSANIVQTVSLASLAQTNTVNASVYDDQHLIIKYWDPTWNWVAAVCRIADLDAGIFSPVRFIGLTNGPETLITHQPAQNLKAIGNEWAGISGYQAVATYQTNVGWWSERTGLLGRTALNTATTAETVSEPESLAHWWNPETLKYETVVTVWYINEGRVNLYSTNSDKAGARFQQSGNPLMKEAYDAGSLPWSNSSQPRQRFTCPTTFAASSIQVGGERRQIVGGVFDPKDFTLYQLTQLAADAREEAAINFKNQRFQISGANDPVLGPCFRGFLSLTNNDPATSDEVLFVSPYGVRVGTSQTLASTSPRFGVHVQPRKSGDGGVYVPELTTPTAPSFVGSSWGLTFGTTYGDMFFGKYDPATKTRTVQWRMNESRIRPETDGTADFGFTTFRLRNGYFVNPIIVSSDESLKIFADPDPITDAAEKAAALEIKSIIRKYKWKKGGDRWHFGVGAQTVGNIMRKHGLKPEDYSFWCRDEWEDQYEAEPAVTVEHPPQYSSLLGVDGEPLLLAPARVEVVEEEKQIKVLSAGERYGIRYEDLWGFILAAL